jgi:hypothetical protein
MAPRDRWWDNPLLKGLSSLVIALSVVFTPSAIDEIRARRRAMPIRIVAPPDSAPGGEAAARHESASRLTWRASSEVTRPPAESIAVTVVITNSGADSARIVVSRYCPILLQLRHPPDIAARPAWDGRERTCMARGREIRLQAGQSETLRTAQSVRDVFGDSLPGGRYLVSAVFQLGGDTVTRAAGDVVVRRP